MGKINNPSVTVKSSLKVQDFYFCRNMTITSDFHSNTRHELDKILSQHDKNNYSKFSFIK